MPAVWPSSKAATPPTDLPYNTPWTPMPKAIRKPRQTAKSTAEAAGYMELDDAQKDASCDIVSVSGGVSSRLGCCNLFDPKSGAKEFRCGTCEHLRHG